MADDDAHSGPIGNTNPGKRGRGGGDPKDARPGKGDNGKGTDPKPGKGK
jgi:hypothetical protein